MLNARHHLAMPTALLVALALCLTTTAQAQSRGDGSIYSRFGVGTLKTFSSSQIEALGGSGTAMQSLNYLNLRNPASWANQVLTRAVASANFQRVRATDDRAGTDPSSLITGGLTAVQLSFPILKQKLGVGLALKPYSRANYRVLASDRQLTPSPGDTASYDINFEGRGGLQQIVGGAGYRVNDYLDLGATAKVLFGTYEDARRITFQTNGYREANVTTATRMIGVTGTLGALYHQGDLLHENDQIDVGAALTLPTALSGEQSKTLGESLNRDTLDVNAPEVREGNLTLPLSARLGAAYRTGPRWLFVADALHEPWSGFDNDLTDGEPFRPAISQDFSDRVRLSGGVEVVPAGNERRAPYLARVAYRLGAYYNRAYAHPNGKNLRTLAATTGLSLPTTLSGTHLDLNVEIGTRGATTGPLVRDRFFSISASVNFGEEWFRERKLQ
jgi:hypothetical protein